MEKETKKYLIIGGAIVVTVGLLAVLWKKYQTTSSASAAAADQSNQDELSLLAASLESNAYAGSGASSYAPQVVRTGAPQSLADEVLALEKALGFAPTTPAPSSPSAPTTPSGSGSTPSPAPTPTPKPEPAPAQDGHPASEMIRYNHGAPIFEMDGVQNLEGVLVS